MAGNPEVLWSGMSSRVADRWITDQRDNVHSRTSLTPITVPPLRCRVGVGTAAPTATEARPTRPNTDLREPEVSRGSPPRPRTRQPPQRLQQPRRWSR